jgi:hypothetical protein
MDIRKHCDSQEEQINKLNADKKIEIDHSEFLDFQLRDSKEQNASLKLELSKHLTQIDSQHFNNQ